MSNSHVKIASASNIIIGVLAFLLFYIWAKVFNSCCSLDHFIFSYLPFSSISRAQNATRIGYFTFPVLYNVSAIFDYNFSRVSDKQFCFRTAAISRKLEALLLSLQDFIDTKLQIDPERQFSMLKDNIMSFFDTGINIVGTTINVTSGIAFYVGIMPVYIFFMIYYREIWANFLIEISPLNRQELTAEILGKMSVVIRSYVGGMLLVMVIVCILNTIGFAIIGLKYALFFGAVIAF